MRSLHNYINGESVEAASGQTSKLINPTTGEVFATFASVSTCPKREMSIP